MEGSGSGGSRSGAGATSPGPQAAARPAQLRDSQLAERVASAALSVCLDPVAIDRWLIDNRNFFLTVLEAGESPIMDPADPVSVEGHLPVPSGCPLRVLTWWKG